MVAELWLLVVMVLREIRVLPIAQQLYVWLVGFEKPVVNYNPTATGKIPVGRTDLLGYYLGTRLGTFRIQGGMWRVPQ